ncbi:unnamed protein product [Eruca vesicaria subsp. sativa]|uniref:Nucleotidyl transferase domain-containing protein n=1 Tax=Eruca vesicaria subsp. sativa TaxID=29727 RepID=A0ABC8M0Q8_ERUVS|nr:unnamed protein product [Eruca vesicaria subsp. sativa]
MEFVQSHVDSNADVTLSCALVSESCASNFGLVKIDRGGQHSFPEKQPGIDLKSMETDTTMLGLSREEATDSPFITSMGVYCFKTKALLDLLAQRYPTSNDFGSEFIPAAIRDHDVQVRISQRIHTPIFLISWIHFLNLLFSLFFQKRKFEFYDPDTPFYTSPRLLPPTKTEKCRDTLMLGADYYQTECEIASLLAKGKVPTGIGKDTKIRKFIIDKNARLDVQEADRPEEGFYIRSGITVVVEKATIQDGTVI